MKNASIDKATYVVIILGTLLHVYLAVCRSMETSFNVFIIPALNILPYVICLVILKMGKKSITALCAALAVLVTDIFLFNNFIFNPGAMGYNLLGIFTPVWKVALALPIGWIVGLMIDKYVKPRQQ